MAPQGLARRSARNSSTRAESRGDRLVRTQLTDLQRARILSAMFDVVTQRGASNVTVAHVVQRSGVSRRTFYEAFSDREDCFLGAFEEAVSYASERVLPAYRSRERWRDRIRAGLVAFLDFLDEEPLIGRLLVCESLAGGPRTLERRSELIVRVTAAIDEGRIQTKRGVALPPLTGEGVLGGVLSVIHSRLGEADCAPLIELANPLMSMIVLPYLGSAAARREFERATVVSSTGVRQESALLSDPFKHAGMRLTYRTVRVLMAVAEHPGASNRVVADTAGIKDQGQISKLLRRLQRIGMITNTGLGPGQGAPNVWTPTASGHQIVSTVRTHTEGRQPERHER